MPQEEQVDSERARPRQPPWVTGRVPQMEITDERADPNPHVTPPRSPGIAMGVLLALVLGLMVIGVILSLL